MKTWVTLRSPTGASAGRVDLGGAIPSLRGVIASSTIVESTCWRAVAIWESSETADAAWFTTFRSRSSHRSRGWVYRMIRPVQASVSKAGAVKSPIQKCSRQIRRRMAAWPRLSVLSTCSRSTVTTAALLD